MDNIPTIYRKCNIIKEDYSSEEKVKWCLRGDFNPEDDFTVIYQELLSSSRVRDKFLGCEFSRKNDFMEIIDIRDAAFLSIQEDCKKYEKNKVEEISKKEFVDYVQNLYSRIHKSCVFGEGEEYIKSIDEGICRELLSELSLNDYQKLKFIIWYNERRYNRFSQHDGLEWPDSLFCEVYFILRIFDQIAPIKGDDIEQSLMKRGMELLAEDPLVDDHSWLGKRLTTKGNFTILMSIGDCLYNLERYFYVSKATHEKANDIGVSKIINETKTDDKELTDVSIYPEPIWLDSKELPGLSLDCFPSILFQYSKTLSESTQTPLELASGMSVACLSASAHGKFSVNVRDDYFEPLNLFLLIVMEPGERKSAATNACLKPINEWEVNRRTALKDKIKEAISARKTMEKRIEHMRKEAAKSEGEDFLFKQEVIIQLEKKLPRVPVYPKVYADDVTAEAFAGMLYEQNERMAIISAEGGIFETIAGRYSGGVPNMDVYLKGHAGDPLRIDRKGDKRSIHLYAPSVSMGLSVQPDVLNGMVSKPGFSGRGFLARFLYLLPNSKVGFRTINPPPTIKSAVNGYHDLITEVLNIGCPVDKETGRVRPYVLKFSKKAQRKYYQFAEEVETWFRQGGRFEQMKKWGNKFVGATVRLAGNFHVVEYYDSEPWKENITDDTFETAIRFMDVIAEHSKAALDLMGEDADIEKARRIWEWVLRRNRMTFTNRDIQQSLKTRYKKWNAIKPGIDVLLERYYLMDLTPGKTRGKLYQVNPAALKE